MAVALFIVAWPVWQGIVAANDDLKFVRTTAPERSLGADLADAWAHSAMFRPMEIAIGRATDVDTLQSPWIMPVHGVALVMLAVAVAGLARRAAPGWPAVAPLALLWVLLSPATTVSAWQVDTGSQTWSAALGAWAMLLAWRCSDAARGGHVPWVTLAALAVVFAVGVNIKETFYGWSAAIGVATLCAVAFALRRDRAVAGRLAWILLPVVALPIAHLVLRVATGGLGAAAGGSEESRYHAELGVNLLANAVIVMAASVGTGPFHLVTDHDANPALRVLPIASVVIAGLAAAAAVGWAWLDRERGAWRPMARAVAVAVVALASTAAVLPMAQASELYALGANFGSGVLLAVAVMALWDATAPLAVTLRRVFAGCTVVALGTIGAYGLASRAHHFALTWLYTRTVNAQIVAFQRGLPPRVGSEPAGIVYFPLPCVYQRSYGQYVVTPVLAVNVEHTEPWLAHRDPERPLLLRLADPPEVPDSRELVVDCTAFPARGHW